MINKQGIWFLTLFSLILVLSIYYITIPTKNLDNSNTEVVNKENNESIDVTITETDSLAALRINDDEIRLQEMEDLRLVLTTIDSSIDEKNNAYEKLKSFLPYKLKPLLFKASSTYASKFSVKSFKTLLNSSSVR